MMIKTKKQTKDKVNGGSGTATADPNPNRLTAAEQKRIKDSQQPENDEQVQRRIKREEAEAEQDKVNAQAKTDADRLWTTGILSAREGIWNQAQAIVIASTKMSPAFYNNWLVSLDILARTASRYKRIGMCKFFLDPEVRKRMSGNVTDWYELSAFDDNRAAFFEALEMIENPKVKDLHDEVERMKKELGLSHNTTKASSKGKGNGTPPPDPTRLRDDIAREYAQRAYDSLTDDQKNEVKELVTLAEGIVKGMSEEPYQTLTPIQQSTVIDLTRKQRNKQRADEAARAIEVDRAAKAGTPVAEPHTEAPRVVSPDAVIQPIKPYPETPAAEPGPVVEVTATVNAEPRQEDSRNLADFDEDIESGDNLELSPEEEAANAVIEMDEWKKKYAELRMIHDEVKKIKHLLYMDGYRGGEVILKLKAATA
jgi:hypothetical protein